MVLLIMLLLILRCNVYTLRTCLFGRAIEYTDGSLYLSFGDVDLNSIGYFTGPETRNVKLSISRR